MKNYEITRATSKKSFRLHNGEVAKVSKNIGIYYNYDEVDTLSSEELTNKVSSDLNEIIKKENLTVKDYSFASRRFGSFGVNFIIYIF